MLLSLLGKLIHTEDAVRCDGCAHTTMLVSFVILEVLFFVHVFIMSATVVGWYPSF